MVAERGVPDQHAVSPERLHAVADDFRGVMRKCRPVRRRIGFEKVMDWHYGA
jgi:hypothetical protein